MGEPHRNISVQHHAPYHFKAQKQLFRLEYFIHKDTIINMIESLPFPQILIIFKLNSNYYWESILTSFTPTRNGRLITLLFSQN